MRIPMLAAFVSAIAIPLAAYAADFSGSVPNGISFGGGGVVTNILPGADIGCVDSGTQCTALSFSGSGHITNIEGGAINGDISFSGVGHTFHFRGGDYNPVYSSGISASGLDHVFNFYGNVTTNVTPGVPFSGTATVSGTLDDGSPIDITVSAGIGPIININPGGGPSANPVMVVTGTCPGTVNFDLSGYTPNGRVDIASATDTTGYQIPPGYTCGGTQTGLGSNTRRRAALTADAAGEISFSRTFNSPNACNVIVQSLDHDSCLTPGVPVPLPTP